MSGARALALDRVLARPGKNGWVGRADDLGATDRQSGAHALGDEGKIDKHLRFVAAQRFESGDESRSRMDRRHTREVVLHVFRNARRVDVQVGLAGAPRNRLGMDDWRIAHVATANVEQPGNRIGQGDDNRIGALRFECTEEVGKLFGGRASGELSRLHLDRARRAGGLVLPNRINKIAVARF
jgi:hypothetical protein